VTSRQRVRDAMNHIETDRPPLDCTMTIEVYNKVLKALDLGLPPKVACGLDLRVVSDLEVVDRMGLDLAYLGLSPNKKHPGFSFGQDVYTDIWGVDYTKTYIGSLVNYVTTSTPLADYELEDLDNYPWPDPDEPSMYEGLRERARKLHEETDKAVIAMFGASIFTLASLMRGMEQWFIDLIAEPEYAVAVMERLAGYYTRVYVNAIRECGEYLDIIRTENDDFGTQEGLLISPNTFKTLCKPVLAKFYKAIRDEAVKYNPDVKLIKHCCGSVVDIVDDLIDIGTDILDPFQVSAKGMDPATMKARFGDRICFHGGVDTQRLLPRGTPEEVCESVKRTNAIMSKGGGYIVCPVHHVEGDVPPENLFAMCKATLGLPLEASL